MRKDVSLWLDGMRATASFLVFVAHLSVFGVAGPELARFVPELGHDAVVLFFVLSGFVISYTTESRHANLTDYLVARGARLWSVALPALVLTYGLAALAGHLVTGLQLERDYQLGKLWLYFPFQLGFGGELWTLSEPPCTNVPWWSLGYEAWYYLLFAAFAFYRGPRRWLLLGLGFAFVGFKLWLLAPVWALGAVLWQLGPRWPLSRGLARALLVATVLAYAGYKASGAESWLVELGNRPFGGVMHSSLGSARNWLHDWVIAVLAGLHLYALGHAHLTFPSWSVRPIRFVASFTFSLYCAHAPLLIFARHTIGYDRNAPLQVIAVALAVLTFIVVFGLLTEHKKEPYRRALEALARGLGSRLPAGGRVRRWLLPNR